MIILTFYSMRLIQFFFDDLLAIKMIQSNMFGVSLAVMGLVNIISGTSSGVIIASIVVLILDSLIGSALFFN